MKWQPFNPMPLFDFLTGKIKAKVQAINADIERLQKNRGNVDAGFEAAQDADVGQLELDEIIIMPTHRAAVALVLKEELRLRREFDRLEEEVHAAICSAREKAVDTHETVQQEVRQALVGIGYVDAEPSHGIRGTITPLFIMTHPRVISSRENLESLQGLVGTRETKNTNNAAAAQVEQMLQGMRDRAIHS